MKADFSRTIVSTTIKVASVGVINGKVETKELPPINVAGTTKVNNDKALRLAKAEYKKVPSLVVLSVENKEEVRGMDFATFLKCSEVVERPASQQKKK